MSQRSLEGIMYHGGRKYKTGVNGQPGLDLRAGSDQDNMLELERTVLRRGGVLELRMAIWMMESAL